MTIYELMDAVIYCDNIETGMKTLLELMTIIEKERYTSKLLENFYSRLQMSLMGIYSLGVGDFDDKSKYCIEKGKYALSLYLALNIPARKKPKQTIKELKNFANENLITFKDCKNNLNSENMIKEVIRYLDDNYKLTDKIFKNKKIKSSFLILDVQNKKDNFEYLSLKVYDALIHHFFIYSNSNSAENKSTIIEEIFYMLSIALITQFTGEPGEITDKGFEMLKKICVPTIDELIKDRKIETFAKFVSVGLMYNTKYQEYDTSDYIHVNDKKIFKMIVEKMLVTI